MTDVLDPKVLDSAETTTTVHEPRTVASRSSRPAFDLSAGARLVLAALAAGAGAIHLAMVPSHWGESTLEGVSFAVAGWLQIAFAVAVVARPSRRLLQVGIGLNAIFIGAWIVSRTAGLPYGAHSGVAEDAGFVDITCVVLEAVLLVTCAVWAYKPRLGARFARGGFAFAAIVAIAVLGLTTAALASPGARNHGHADGPGGVAADGHTHDDPSGGGAPADDKGFSQLHNGQHADMTLHPLDAGTQAELNRQLAITRDVAKLTPTVAAAEKAGYVRVGPYLPGIGGAHYWKGVGAEGGIGGPRFNRDGLVDDNDLRNPLMLIFNGTKPTSEIAGFMYYSMAGFEPAGFAGRNDTWHYHESLCLKMGANGSVDVPYGLDHAATKQQCDAAGAQMMNTTQYMVHVWSVPGYEMTLNDGGVFGEENRKLACADGSYYTLPMDEWLTHPLNACKAQ